MSSSARRSVDARLVGERRSPLAPAWGAALLLALAVTPASAAETAFDTCDADSVDAQVLTLCLEGLAGETAEALAAVQRRAEAYFGGLDALTGNDRASRTLDQAQAAFALFRELDCHLAEIDHGLGQAAVDAGLACRIDHDRVRMATLLRLIDDDETPIPEAGPADVTDNALFGISWRVVEIAGEPVDAGIEITLELDDDGTFIGIGGCNRYFGTARLGEAGALAFGEVGSTRMACADPVMEHERQYFAALGQVATTALAADTLELQDAQGATLVRLERRSD